MKEIDLPTVHPQVPTTQERLTLLYRSLFGRNSSLVTFICIVTLTVQNHDVIFPHPSSHTCTIIHPTQSHLPYDYLTSYLIWLSLEEFKLYIKARGTHLPVTF